MVSETYYGLILSVIVHIVTSGLSISQPDPSTCAPTRRGACLLARTLAAERHLLSSRTADGTSTSTRNSPPFNARSASNFLLTRLIWRPTCSHTCLWSPEKSSYVAFLDVRNSTSTNQRLTNITSKSIPTRPKTKWRFLVRCCMKLILIRLMKTILQRWFHIRERLSVVTVNYRELRRRNERETKLRNQLLFKNSNGTPNR